LRNALADILNGTDIASSNFMTMEQFLQDPPAPWNESIMRNAKAGQVKIEDILIGNPDSYQLGKMVG
jgi:hypothetical protein